MWVKQMSVSDWHKLFREHDQTLAQVRVIEKRLENQPGYKLASWEQNAMQAYKLLTSNQ